MHHKTTIIKKKLKKNFLSLNLFENCESNFSPFSQKPTSTKNIKYKQFRRKVEVKTGKQKGL